MSDLAIVLVHYRTPALLVDAVRALVGDLEASHLAAEIVVIDNGSEAGERRAWEGLPMRRIDPGTNLGYAGGVRRGVEATRAARIVAMNPDVLVARGCLAALVAELDRGAAAAGPQFFWDRGERLLLPPTESRSAAAEIRAALARRFPSARIPGLGAGAARRAWRRHARRHWEATRAFPSAALSGALLAFRRDAWTKVGPFDEGFRLYFEETDWLLRVSAAGLESRFVPGARAVHLYAQSSVQEPQSARWFGEAQQRFRRRHLGRPLAAALTWLAGAPPRRDAERASPRALTTPPALTAEDLGLRRAPAWIEVALAESGFPAAGEPIALPTGTWRMPEEIWHRLPPGELWIRGLDTQGREGTALCVSRPPLAAAAQEDRPMDPPMHPTSGRAPDDAEAR